VTISPIEANARGVELGEAVINAVADWQANSPRTQQRTLGMSQIGGCREYMRATLAGDPKMKGAPLKWPAYLGTAVGDHIERILQSYGFATQEDAELTLRIFDDFTITVKGHLDIRGPNMIGDLKTRNELAEVRREGPPFKEKAQLAGYVMAKYDEGVLDEDGIGSLIYLDRSGGDSTAFTWTLTVPQARLILAAVVERIRDVVRAMDAGESQGYLRDEPESWCKAVGCPFYNGCWTGYEPSGAIEHPEEIRKVAEFVEAREADVEAAAIRKAKRAALEGVEGVVAEGPLKGTVVRWNLSKNQHDGVSPRLDVRVPK